MKISSLPHPAEAVATWVMVILEFTVSDFVNGINVGYSAVNMVQTRSRTTLFLYAIH